jgi:hypothetical protein
MEKSQTSQEMTSEPRKSVLRLRVKDECPDWVFLVDDMGTILDGCKRNDHRNLNILVKMIEYSGSLMKEVKWL